MARRRSPKSYIFEEDYFVKVSIMLCLSCPTLEPMCRRKHIEALRERTAIFSFSLVQAW